VCQDDDLLMERTAAGDEAAFRRLVTRWQQPVFAFLMHMLGSVEEAEDMTQDTFMKVYRQAGRYRSEGRFQSWLMRIAGNHARSILRRRKILRWVGFDQASHDRPATGDDPLAELARHETVRQVHDAVASLPPRQRSAVILKRFQGLSYQEIADAMDTTIPAVESLLQRAAESLRQRLEAPGSLSLRKERS
jgi:RNA polymerase sigma-70 factor, ECF subfamily